MTIAEVLMSKAVVTAAVVASLIKQVCKALMRLKNSRWMQRLKHKLYYVVCVLAYSFGISDYILHFSIIRHILQ